MIDTPKAFDHKAQGRESANAPWGHGDPIKSTLIRVASPAASSL